MLEETLETKKQELAIERQDVAVLLSNEMLLHLPSTAELHEISNLIFDKVSVDEICGRFNEESRTLFAGQRDELLKKYDRYKHSPTFLSHLATLTELSGDLNGSVTFLRSGTEVDSSAFHAHRLGRAFMALGKLDAAEQTFGAADLRTDAGANLGLACLAFLRGKHGQASAFVDSALDIDAASFNALLLAGILELTNNHSDQAIRYFRSAIEERADSPASYMLLGTAYHRDGLRDKAVDMFRRAAAITPIDENAVILYVDALFSERRYEQVVRVLEDFTRFEQKSVAVWDRLGRAFYQLGKNTKALNAFRHQASVLEHCGVWNNIALVYWRMGDTKNAAKYLSLAVKVTIEEDFPTFLPLYNMFIFLRNRGNLEEAISVSEMIPKDRMNDLIGTPIASSILALRCESLAELGRLDDAEHELDALLNAQNVNRELRLTALQSATFFYSVVRPDMDKALRSARMLLDEIKKGDIPVERIGLLLNNVVFVFIEFGRTNEADQLIAKLSPWIHKSPTATATLGLMHLRKGRVELGRRLYVEAISLADARLKSRLKEKLQLEVGKVLLREGKSRAAARCLKEAATSDLGGIKTEAARLLKTLDR